MWVLANPRAGRGLGGTVGEATATLLSASGYEVEMANERPAEATYVQRPGAVVVIGGDGTLREAVARLLELSDGDALPPVLPVSLGTANLLGQHLSRPRSVWDIGLESAVAMAADAVSERVPTLAFGGMSVNPRRIVRRWSLSPRRAARQRAGQVLAALERDRRVRLDVGIANGRAFLLMAGIGFDAHVIHALDERRSGPINLLSYALPAASAVARYGFPPLRVDVDGRRIFGPRPGVVMVSNLPQYGTGFPLIPHARGDDGLLDVVALPCRSRVDIGRLFALAAGGQHLDGTGVARGRGRVVDVLSDVPVPVQIDGDPGGHLPLRAEMSPRQATFIVPLETV